MSPIAGGELFRDSTPYYAGNEYVKERRWLLAKEASLRNPCAREKSVLNVKSLQGSDIMSEWLYSRLYWTEKKRQGPNQYHTEGQVVLSRHVYAGGFKLMGQAPRPDVKVNLEFSRQARLARSGSSKVSAASRM